MGDRDWKKREPDDEGDFEERPDDLHDPEAADILDGETPAEVTCPHCGRTLIEDADWCPKCRRYLADGGGPVEERRMLPRMVRYVVALILLLVAAGVVGMLMLGWWRHG